MDVLPPNSLDFKANAYSFCMLPCSETEVYLVLNLLDFIGNA